jgi:hypothetical protein
MNKCDVYIVGVMPSGPVKIGLSTNFRNRLVCLQTGFHLDLKLIRKWKLNCSSATRLERAAHRELKDVQLKGEWFSCSPDVAIAAIAQIGKRTKRFRDWTPYQAEGSTPLISAAASKGGKANSKRAELNFWRQFAIIKDDWHGPEKSKVLMKRAKIRHHDTFRSYLLFTRWEWRRLTDGKRASVLKQRLADLRKRYPDEQI